MKVHWIMLLFSFSLGIGIAEERRETYVFDGLTLEVTGKT
jgi:hypothetical protein